MTTDTQLAPTDAEIDALNEQFRWDTTEGRRDLVRAALARWGQPAHSGEPVYAFRRKGLDDFCTCTEKRYAELSAKPNLFETRIFYTAPRPVEREPLTPEQMDAALGSAKKVKPGYVGWVTDQRRELGRAVERAHGIKKGGQHGNE